MGCVGLGAIAPGCERLVSLLHESKHTRSLLRGSIPEFAAVCSVVAHIVRTSLLHAAATMSGDSLPMCPYGKSCYRLNPVHFDAYNHPHLPNNRPAAWGPAPATTNVRASRSSCRQVAPRSPPYVARAPCCAYVRVVSRRRLRSVLARNEAVRTIGQLQLQLRLLLASPHHLVRNNAPSRRRPRSAVQTSLQGRRRLLMPNPCRSHNASQSQLTRTMRRPHKAPLPTQLRLRAARSSISSAYVGRTWWHLVSMMIRARFVLLP